MGSEEALAAIHGPRLERLLEHLVETPVRGVLYEGTEAGAEIVRAAERTWHIPATTFAPKPSQVPHSDTADGLAGEVKALLGRRT